MVAVISAKVVILKRDASPCLDADRHALATAPGRDQISAINSFCFLDINSRRQTAIYVCPSHATPMPLRGAGASRFGGDVGFGSTHLYGTIGVKVLIMGRISLFDR